MKAIKKMAFAALFALALGSFTSCKSNDTTTTETSGVDTTTVQTTEVMPATTDTTIVDTTGTTKP